MDQHIDLSKMFRGFFNGLRNLVILGNIAFFHPFAIHLFGQGLDAALEHFASVTDADVRALALESLRDSPRNRFVVRKTKNKCVLSFQ